MGQRVVIADAVYAATNNSTDQVKTGETDAMHLVINMRIVPGVQTVTFKVQGKDALGNYYDILTSAAIVAVSQVVMKIGRGFLAAANTVANDGLPDVWRVVATHSGAGNFTYNVCVNDVK